MEKRNLPNATAVLILGILSILTCWCYGIFGLILSIIALFLAKKDIAAYKENPELYNNYSNLNTGKIISIVGLILSIISILFFIYVFSNFSQEQLQQMQLEMMKK